MDYKIAIPSKDRVKDFNKMTYEKIILKYNIPLKDVYVFVPKDNESEYKEAFKDINIVVAPNGFMNTIKFIHKYFKDKQKFVYINDDVSKIVKVINDKKVVEVKDFKSLIETIFKTMVKMGYGLAGLYPTPNPRFMDKAKPITTDLRFVFDALHFQINYKNIKLSIQSKLDFETTIQYYIRDGGVLRFNHYSMRTRYATGRVAKVNESEDTDKFIKKYGKYISKVITHKNGTTSFLLKKNP